MLIRLEFQNESNFSAAVVALALHSSSWEVEADRRTPGELKARQSSVVRYSLKNKSCASECVYITYIHTYT